MPDIAKLEALLKDRLAEKPTSGDGRASANFPVVMNARLAVRLGQVRQKLAMAENDVDQWAKEAALDKRQGGARKVPADLTAAVTEMQAEVEKAETEAEDVTVVVRLIAMRSDLYDELLKQQPPREGNDLDKESGYNVDVLPDMLLHECAAVVLDLDGNELPQFNAQDVVKGLSDGERIVGCNIVTGLNRQVHSIPFSAANSQSRQRSGGKPKRR